MTILSVLISGVARLKTIFKEIAMRTAIQCPECDRLFDLLDEDQANEWGYGHDCEPNEHGVITNPDERSY